MSESGVTTGRASTSWRLPRTWKPWTRQVTLRCLLLAGGYVFWAGYLVFALTSTANLASTGSPPPPPQTMYQADPAITRAIFTLAGIALLVETASVLWRVARRSHRVGVTGLAVASLGAMVALLGFMTIGVFIAPFVAICMVMALPIGREVLTPPPTPLPGWFHDPWGHQAWRFWDGNSWTPYTSD